MKRYLKIKIKHLAEEARIIRHEERKTTGMEKWKLQHHRKTVVRNAARRTQFAYAILRGKTLQQTARGYKLQRGDENEVTKMVKKYGSGETVENWF